ncbi:MAG: hypothetical protein WA419_12060 [Silvibacterium sp.]
MLEQVVRTEGWIIDGLQFKWADAVLDRFDRIIVIDMPIFRNKFQIMKRFCKQHFGSEPSDYKPTLKTLAQIFKWSSDYRNHERQLLIRKVERFQSKTVFAKEAVQALKTLDAARSASSVLNLICSRHFRKYAELLFVRAASRLP